MKYLLLLISSLSYSISIAQNVNIPDANFKNTLLNDISINTDGNNEISIEEALNTNYLIISGLNITSVIGIQEFINLDTLGIGMTSIAEIDLSKNQNLKFLDASQGSFTTIDIKNCTLLQTLKLYYNNISELDISLCESLTRVELHCNNKSIDNPNLTCVSVYNVNYAQPHFLYAKCWELNPKQYPIDFFQENGGTITNTKELSDISLSIFPNPVKNILYITETVPLITKEIYSLDGVLIKTDNSSNTELLVQDLASGIYTINITTEKRTRIQRFVKE